MISLVIGSYIIIKLRRFHFFQIIRVDGPQSHILKQGTPVMGGLIILISIILSIMICADLSNLYVWYMLFILIMYGILGLVDDFLKIKRSSTRGLNALHKYFWQSVIALILIISIFVYNKNYISMRLVIPFCTNIILELGIWYVLIAYFVIVGTSNAVNLSDGLDGLVIVPIILVTSGFAIIAYITNNEFFSNYLHISYVRNSGELIVVCAAIIGAGLGFLWFNAHPAEIFMGDTGSLSLGAALGAISVFLCQECLLLIMGGMFVVESVSVILQVIYFKLFRRRIFKMAPIHHHFELKGYPESRITVRFWIISLILVLFGLVILKIRSI